MSNNDQPIACRLSSAELREREASLLLEFKSGVVGFKELPHGFCFELPGAPRWLALCAELIAAERECCPFLQFALEADPNLGPIRLKITGPAATSELVRNLFVPR